jgi:hypothetical protein
VGSTGGLFSQGRTGCTGEPWEWRPGGINGSGDGPTEELLIETAVIGCQGLRLALSVGGASPYQRWLFAVLTLPTALTR